MPLLEGKVAIVTGAATRVGAAIVQSIVDEGGRVTALDINDRGLDKVVAEAGASVVGCSADITKDTDLDACIDQTLTSHGQIDILINLAVSYRDNGMASTRADWNFNLNTNVTSGALFIQKVHPHMATQGGGAILNFSSVGAKVAQAGRLPYTASKAAIIAITRSFALYLAEDNIRVNSISPAGMWSDSVAALTQGNREMADSVAAVAQLIPRVADPTEIANIAVFLCSDKASFITGADIAADGGSSALGPEYGTNIMSLMAGQRENL